MALGVKDARHLFVGMGHVLQYFGDLVLHGHVSFALGALHQHMRRKPGRLQISSES
ncbi:hypothetical protein D3C77_752290 [compost metagenome]